jgi:Rrf2 family iron-sulfur cluster assembly transcriptional regulator
MPSRLMLSRTAAIALRALVELAREPAVTLSVAELARRQQLPQPMLEQILLRLRRAGLLEARRGRHGGYRLAQQPEALPLARVLQAVEIPRGMSQARAGEDRVTHPDGARQASACGGEAPVPTGPIAGWGQQDWLDSGRMGEGPAPGESLGASAGHRVEQQLRRRLERLVQLELQRLTLAELLYDQRSWEASLGPEGGVMLS